jgi:hypothetical protein
MHGYFYEGVFLFQPLRLGHQAVKACCCFLPDFLLERIPPRPSSYAVPGVPGGSLGK